MTTPTAKSIKEVKIKQEIIDTTNNPYEILRSGEKQEPEEKLGKNVPVDLTTNETLEKLQKKAMDTTQLMLEALEEVSNKPQRSNKRTIDTVQEDDRYTQPVHDGTTEQENEMDANIGDTIGNRCQHGGEGRQDRFI